MSYSLRWFNVAAAIVLFALCIVGFTTLSAFTHWPNTNEGWLITLTVSGVVGILPLLGGIMSFLQKSRANVEGPFGIKLDFSKAVAVASLGNAKLAENFLQAGVRIEESSIRGLNEAAVRATQETVVIVDIEDGRAWYKSRLFALAVTAEIARAPRLIVLVGQRSGLSSQVIGMIKPQDLVKALTITDQNYARLWHHVRAYVTRLEANMATNDPNFPNYASYVSAYKEYGRASAMHITVDQIRHPDPSLQMPQPLESDYIQPWVTIAELDGALAPWLVRDTLDLDRPEGDKIASVLSAKFDVVIASRQGTYAGLIDVNRVARDLLSQLLSRHQPE